MEKKPYRPLTEAQKRALKLGQHIRTISCVEALAKFFDPPLGEEIRRICNLEMERLGYETFVERRARVRKALIDGSFYTKPKSFWRFQKRKN